MAQVIPSDDELFDVISKEALIDRATLKRDANLEDLGIASLDVISVLFEVEERFGIVVEAEELTDCKTLGQLMDKVKAKAQAAPEPQDPWATSSRYPRSIAGRSARSVWRRCHAPLPRSASNAATPRATTAGSARANPEQLARTAGSRYASGRHQ